MNISEHTPPRILALMAITGALAAQTPTWQQLAAWPAPSPRANLPMAYDCMRHCAVVVGGQFGYGTHFADTWEFDGAVWTQRQPAIQPPVRAMAAMAYDERARQCLLFGGATPAPGFGFGPRRNDTWLWDGSQWQQATPQHSPSPRLGHALAYDEVRHRIVLFGGHDNDDHDDTWEWDGTDWTERLPVTIPPPQASHSMAYDSVRQVTILVGASATANSVWAWDGVDWAALAPVTTSALVPWQQLAFDRERGRCVLQRCRASATTSARFAETWEFDGTTWAMMPAVNQPVALSRAGIVYDRHQGRVLLFGGRDSVDFSHNSTWAYGVQGLAVAQPFGVGCGSPELKATPDAASRPLVGTTQRVDIEQAPSGLAYISFGWSDAQAGPFGLPLAMDPFGMPGCFLLQSSDAFMLPCTTTGTATARFTLQLPTAAGFLGMRYFLQPWALAPGAPANAIVANAIAVTVGNV